MYNFQRPAGISQPPEGSQKVAKEQPSTQQKPEEKSPSPSQEEVKKKPAGAVSLFGGIDVLAKKQDKSHEEEADDLFLSKDSPLPNVREEGKEDKAKIKTVSLFDEEEEEDESGWKDPIFTPKKPTEEKTPEVCLPKNGSLFCNHQKGKRFCFCYSPQTSICRQTAPASSWMKSCCSVRPNRRTTTRMWTSLPPQSMYLLLLL